MKTLKRIAFCIVAILFAVPAFAQSSIVTAVLIDSDSGEPLPYATVSVTPEGTKTASSYCLSDSEGKVRLQNVKKGNYTLKAELMGYKAFTVNITKESAALNLGTLKILPDQQVLEAAKITDVGNPIIVKKDTIEYNASSFKTSDSDMLIDLLKKLPGVEVESDGSITANGETIKKITIDGRTFFLDDPQLASKNIPSKIIEKVKVIEKKSDQAIFTGIDDGEEETIIDLNIKKGMINGWFGNVMGGGGHDIPSDLNNMNDWRWQGAGFVGNFTDKSQISVILNANNTNNRGFNDMAGSMMGNMRGGGNRGMGRGRNSAGITTSWMAGVNGDWTLLDNKMQLGANYLYNGTNKLVNESSLKDTYVSEGSTLKYVNTGSNITNSQGHRVGVRLEHKFNKNSSIVFEPQFNIGGGDFDEYSKFTTYLNDTTNWVNDGFNKNTGANKNWTTSGNLLYRQRLGKAGRTLTLNGRWNFSDNDLIGFNQSRSNSADTLESVNQRFNQNASNMQLTGGFTYTEPLWDEKLFLEANYNFTWRQQNSDKETWDSGLYDKTREDLYVYNYDGEIRSDTYSNNILNLSRTHRAGLNLMYQKKKFNAQLGCSAVPTYTYNRTEKGGSVKEYESNVLNWSPQANLRYEITDNQNLRFNYNGNENQPSTSQLMPVPDNSDPMNISLGNPNLIPYFSHNMRLNYRFTDKKSFTSLNASVQGSAVQNPIISTTWYDATGTQFSLPINGTTNGSCNFRLMVNAPIAKSKFSIFSFTRASYSNTTNYVSNGIIDMSKYYIGGDKFNFDYDSFLKDFYAEDGLRDKYFSLNLSQTLNLTENLRFTYRSDLVELIAGMRTRMNKGWYTVAKGNTNTTWDNEATASMNWTIPGGVNIIADFNYDWYNGYTTQQDPQAILNAEITKTLFKNKVTLSLKGYDLIGQAKNLSVSDTQNYHQETRNNTLGRYVILSITYRFGNFSKLHDKMESDRKRMDRGDFRGGPGGYGPPPGGPR